MTTDCFGNVLTDIEWVPVLDASGTERRVTLETVLRDGHTFGGFGNALTPLERETLHRFLPTVVAMVLQTLDDNALDRVHDEGVLPAAAVDAFVAAHKDRFFLRHPQIPFLQRHDITEDTVRGCVTGKMRLVDVDPKKGVSAPIRLLHPHVPGGSSSLWAVRVDHRDPNTDLGVLTLLLAVAWWQTRQGNAKSFEGRKMEAGAAGQAGIRPLSAHPVGPTLMWSLLANVFEEWVESTDQPMWLDRAGQPANLATRPVSLWRVTYARNIPFVLWEERDGTSDPVPVGYVIGPDGSTPPRLVASEKNNENLVALRASDPHRLYIHLDKKTGTEIKQVSAMDVRLWSIEGYSRWVNAHTYNTLTRWRQRRFVTPTDGWEVGVYSEVCHTTGSREFSDWCTLPLSVAQPASEHATLLASLTETLRTFRKDMADPMSVACKGRAPKRGKKSSAGAKNTTDLVALPTATAMFYANAEADYMRVAMSPVTGELVDLPACVRSLAHLAVAAFDAATEPMLTPATTAQVHLARAMYRRRCQRIVAATPVTPSMAAPKQPITNHATTHRKRPT